jgi:hypothetical protein
VLGGGGPPHPFFQTAKHSGTMSNYDKGDLR